jgi:class 3 adenylate cyclase
MAEGPAESGPVLGSRFQAGWDAIDRISLRFRDRDLEQAYQANLLETRRPRQRLSYVSGALKFATLAVAAPLLHALPPWPVSAFLGVAAIINVFSALLIDRAATTAQLDAVGIVAQLLTGFTLVSMTVAIGAFTRFAAPALMGIAIFSLGMSRHPVRNAVVISTGQTLWFVGAGLAQGLAPGIFVDTIILSATLAGASIGTYIAERADRRLFTQGLVVADLNRRVNELFHRYVAPEVADAIIADSTKAQLGGEEVEISVLFADLTGFTSFSERVRPDEAVAMLNAAFGAAVPVVLGEGGTVVQFAGDALMAIFNAPMRQPDHALRAATAALRLQEVTAQVRADPDTPYFRVGLNSGPALVGNIGSAELHTFTAIGDTINVAARLQSIAAAGSVVIGEHTRVLLGDTAVTRPLGTPELKGKASRVAAWELLAIAKADLVPTSPRGNQER